MRLAYFLARNKVSVQCECPIIRFLAKRKASIGRNESINDAEAHQNLGNVQDILGIRMA